MSITSRESYDRFIEDYKWLENKSLNIYRSINNDSTYSSMLYFSLRMYEKFEITSDYLRIWYSNSSDRDMWAYIDIPWEQIYKNTTETYISTMYLNWKHQTDEKNKEIQKIKEERERKLFEELKAKYESKQ